jgi:pyridoxine 5-phosphate synthase
VSLFMDPEPEQIDRARACGADRIELYTGPFARHGLAPRHRSRDSRAALAALPGRRPARGGWGLGVNAGHDLDLGNLPLFRQIREVAEVSIGHALISDALDMGLGAPWRRYLDRLQARRPW